MAMNSPSSNNAAAVNGGGGISLSWNQVVAATAPPLAATVSATNSSNNNGGGKKHAWNKSSANGGGGGGGSSLMEEAKPPVMNDAYSWPALLDSARATVKLPSLSPVNASVPELQGTGNIAPLPQRQVKDVVQTHQRSYKRDNSNTSSNGGYSPHLSGSHNHGTRSGFVPNDHHPRHNSFRYRNGGPHPRGDGAHHRNYGGRHEGHGNQGWNNHRNFNGRENYMSHRFGPRFIPPLAYPIPLTPMYPLPPPAPIRPLSHVGFSGFHPSMIYVPPHLGSPPSDPDLHTRIVNQIDYYFSKDNLIKDVYLRQHMDEQGWVPISLIAGFNKVHQLTQSIQIVLEAIRTSSVVEVYGDKIRRRDDWRRWIIPLGVLPNVASTRY